MLYLDHLGNVMIINNKYYWKKGETKSCEFGKWQSPAHAHVVVVVRSACRNNKGVVDNTARYIRAGEEVMVEKEGVGGGQW